MELVKKLIEVQHELKAPKGQENSFGKYKYRSAEDILEAVKPLNAKAGLLLTLSDEPIFIGDWHYIKATATITDGKDSHIVTAYARESLTKKGMDESQITGTASSYARKYALNGLYLIDDTKDADTDEFQKQQTSNQTPPKQNQQPNQQAVKLASEAQRNSINAKLKNVASKTNADPLDVFKAAQQKLGIIKNTREMTSSEASKFINHLITLEG